MKSSVLNISGFTFSMIEHWWLIILSILINVAMALYEKASESNIEKRRVEWINKNMPKNAYKYEVYIKNPTEFLTEKKDSSRGRIV